MGQETTVLVNLPIAFTTGGYWCHMSTSSWNPSNRGLVTAIPNGTSQIKLINGNAGISDCRWYIVGKQQWGTSTSEKTKTFPIAFSNSCYSVLNIMNVNSNRYENPYVIDVTASSFKSGLSGVNYAMYWIAVGKQQWGEYIPTNANLGYRITLPITYSSSTSYIVVCSNDDTTNSYICTSAAKRIDEKQIDLASAINGDFYQTQPVSIICLGF